MCLGVARVGAAPDNPSIANAWLEVSLRIGLLFSMSAVFHLFLILACVYVCMHYITLHFISSSVAI
jgi:hypothetical protein